MRSIAVIFLLFIPLIGNSQEADLIRRQADEERKAGRYESAIALYRDALSETDQLPDAHMGISDAYRLSFQYEEAERSYRKVRNTWADRFPASIFYYGLMLKMNGNFEASIDEFETFINEIGDSGRYPDFIEQAYVEKAGAELAMFIVDEGTHDLIHMNAPVNSNFNDFSPEMYGDILLLTSGRGKGWSARKDLKYGESFMDQYAFRQEGREWVSYDLGLLDAVNGKFHEGNGTFNSSFTKFYFTSCGDNTVHCRIFVTEQDPDQEWSKPRPLNSRINLPGTDAKQPAVSSSGDTLIFISNRPGGAGQNDIWMSVSLGGDNWGAPVNLKEINTSFNELSPRLAGNGILLFSSEGHQSLGGFDLYLYDMVSEENKVVNMGMPFSSSRDDAYAVIRDSLIYFSSNRKGGLGNFDLYSLKLDQPYAFFKELFQNSPSALRSDVGRREYEEMEEARVKLVDDPFAYEALPDRQKQLISEVIKSRRAGRPLPSELEYLDDSEREFILEIAAKQMKRSSGN